MEKQNQLEEKVEIKDDTAINLNNFIKGLVNPQTGFAALKWSVLFGSPFIPEVLDYLQNSSNLAHYLLASALVETAMAGVRAFEKSAVKKTNWIFGEIVRYWPAEIYMPKMIGTLINQ